MIERIGTAEAERLVADGSVRVLDVRTPEEFVGLGHIPGADLLPVDLIASAPAVLPLDGAPILVYCEHGIRSRAAAALLDRAGYPRVIEMAGGMSVWSGPRAFDARPLLGPSAWVVSNADLYGSVRRILDVACGRGRHALLLAAAGFEVHAIDRDPALVEGLRRIADRLGLPLAADASDLEQGTPDLGDRGYDLAIVVNYLHRPLFEPIRRALAPGGLIVAETFLEEQARIGKPSNPAFLLAPGELRSLVAPFEVLRYREGLHEGRYIASIVARRSG